MLILIAFVILFGSSRATITSSTNTASAQNNTLIKTDSIVLNSSDDFVPASSNLDTEQILANELKKYKPLPVYYGQEPYHNFSYFATITYNSGTYLESCATTSMSPTFDCRSVLLIIPARGHNVSVGDIVMFSASFWKESHGTEYINHRIIDIGYDSEGKYYITKGDFNLLPDVDKLRDRFITWIIVGKWVK